MDKKRVYENCQKVRLANCQSMQTNPKMSTESGSNNDILDQYRNISAKLKKRFLRKPNVTEACENFTSLGQTCENWELPAYASLCWIAAARCEGSLNNTTGETTCLVRAGRQFFKAEESDFNLGCTSPAMENLQAGLGCYAHASSKLPEDSPIPIGLSLEIVEFLQKIGRVDYVEDYLKSSIDLAGNSNLSTKIHCLLLLAQNFVQLSDYTAALDTFTEVTQILETSPNNGAHSKILLKAEINKILLLLILRPAVQKLSQNSAKLLEKYTWGDRNDKSLQACAMPEKLFLLLQSLVMTCQSESCNLIELEKELWQFLDNDDKNLLRTLVRLY